MAAQPLVTTLIGSAQADQSRKTRRRKAKRVAATATEPERAGRAAGSARGLGREIPSRRGSRWVSPRYEKP